MSLLAPAHGRRKHPRSVAAALVVLARLAAPLPSPAQSAEDSIVSREISELHRLVNVHRRAAGCEALEWHEATARVAEAHSTDMSRREFFDHVTPEGTHLSERLLAGGVTWSGSIAENMLGIAHRRENEIVVARAEAPSAPEAPKPSASVRGAEVVIELWMDSPPHRGNIEDCAFTHQGLGLFRDRWTQVLIERPRG